MTFSFNTRNGCALRETPSSTLIGLFSNLSNQRTAQLSIFGESWLLNALKVVLTAKIAFSHLENYTHSSWKRFRRRVEDMKYQAGVLCFKHQSLYFWGENWKRATNFTMFNLVLASYTLQYKEVNQVNYLSSWTKYLDHQQRAKFAGWIFLLFRLYNHKLECQSNAEITWFSSQWPCYLLYSTKRGPVKWRSEQVK